jgi:hypothetical protein
MPERYRVDDYDESIGNGEPAEEHAVDGLLFIFESMRDEFIVAVGDVSEVKDWG